MPFGAVQRGSKMGYGKITWTSALSAKTAFFRTYDFIPDFPFCQAVKEEFLTGTSVGIPAFTLACQFLREVA